MRLFFALSLPDDVRRDAARQAEAAKHIGALRAVPAEALHLTLKFLGEVPEDRRPLIESIGGAVAARHPRMSLRLSGGGAFPDTRRAHVFWAGLAGDVGSLSALAADLDAALAEAGFAREPRAFTPHLTLARVRGDARVPRGDAETFQAALAPLSTRPFDAREIHLFRSHLGPTGSRYETIGTFPLA